MGGGVGGLRVFCKAPSLASYIPPALLCQSHKAKARRGGASTIGPGATGAGVALRQAAERPDLNRMPELRGANTHGLLRALPWSL